MSVDDYIIFKRIAEALERIAVAVEAMAAGVDPTMPAECQKKQCSYFKHYLAFGPADLTHEGYHAAQEAGLTHRENCSRLAVNQPCRTCDSYEQRLRA